MRMVLRMNFIVAAVICAQVFADEPTEQQLKWIKENAIAFKTVEAENGFEDLAPLKELIGDARIVSLGESTHGSREIFQMKHRLVEFLASEMGFTIFSIEASMPESYRVNDYVLNGKGDPRRLIAGMYFLDLEHRGGVGHGSVDAWLQREDDGANRVHWFRHANAGCG